MSQSRPKGAKVTLKVDVEVFKRLEDAESFLEKSYKTKYTKSQVIDVLLRWSKEPMNKIRQLEEEKVKLIQA